MNPLSRSLIARHHPLPLRFSARAGAFMAAALMLFAGAPVTTSAAEFTLPNLVPLPPQKIYIDRADPYYEIPFTEEKAIRFATSVFNDGGVPLDLLYTPGSTDDLPFNERDVSQCVSFAGPICLERRLIGRANNQSDDTRDLIDQEGWVMLGPMARYALLPVTPDGLPDFDAPPVQTWPGQFMCWHDFDRRPETAQTSVSLYPACGGSRQGLTPGFGVARLKQWSGQQVPLEGLASGVYALVIELNPDGAIFETSYEDNRSWVVLEITTDPECKQHAFTILREGIS